MNWISLLYAFISTVILTGLIRQLCLVFDIVDHPSQRRTHRGITPRGGGISIVIVFMSFILFYQFSKNYYFALLPVIPIALMGFWDDVSSLSARVRLFVQFLCASLSIYMIDDYQVFCQILGFNLPYWFCIIMATFFIVWSTNLYNFMDGVNGLAGIEALCFSSFMAYLSMNDLQYEWGYLWMILACGAGGFLVWNFPVAKIFLGDIGSYFFGFVFSVLLMKVATVHSQWFWSGIIVLGYFIVDATLTLMVRIWNQFSLTEAHRTHAYQMLWKKFNQSHSIVTMSILILNLCWLMPWAYLVAKSEVPVIYGLIISYLPILYLVLTSKAGTVEALKKQSL